MNIFLGILAWIPFFLFIFVHQEEILQKRVFFSYVLSSLLILIITWVMRWFFPEIDAPYFFACCQLTIILLHAGFGYIWKKYFGRIPELSRNPKKKWDILYYALILALMYIIGFIAGDWIWTIVMG